MAPREKRRDTQTFDRWPYPCIQQFSRCRDTSNFKWGEIRKKSWKRISVSLRRSLTIFSFSKYLILCKVINLDQNNVRCREEGGGYISLLFCWMYSPRSGHHSIIWTSMQHRDNVNSNSLASPQTSHVTSTKMK